jgi:muramoyltetrapeptide carboxypeptidase
MCKGLGKSKFYLLFLLMNRKGFISGLAAGIVTAPLLGFSRLATAHAEDTIPGLTSQDGSFESLIPPSTEPRRFIVPPYLMPGDTIGITCPAGFITWEEIKPAVTLMENWGWKIKIGSTVGKRDFTFGGSDQERLQDMQSMIDDHEVKAIMCARGGYGAVRTVDFINFEKLRNRPKWIIGFSDITVIHSHLSTNFQVASIHSKMCNSFPEKWPTTDVTQMDSILSIRNALAGQRMSYDVPPHPLNRPGKAKGVLVGGNMKTLESLTGTSSGLQPAGCLLFLEDTNEYLYSIDRMFRHFKRSGKLNDLAGIIIGGFKIKPDDPGEEFGRTLHDIVLEQVREFDYPVCFDFPVGHQKNNFALKCGVIHELTVQKDKVNLFEHLNK